MSQFTEVDIDTPELGKFKIIVPDVNRPVWFGPFETGKLAIYHCQMSDEPKLPCVAFIYVITEQADNTFDFYGYEILEVNDDANALIMINSLLKMIKTRFLDNIVSYRREHGLSVH